MAKCEKMEFVKGHTEKNGGYDWTRLDVYFKAVDNGDPVRISAFLRGDQVRLIGLTDEECKTK